MSTTPEPLNGRTFRHRTLRGSRFVGCDLGDVVVRGSDITGIELDSPWLMEGGTLVVNGVDVVPLVDAELDRRFPGRELRGATDPAGLHRAWSALEQTWAATVSRAEAMPAGTVDASVAGEWCLTQTLRHLVHATDVWLGKAVLSQEQPYHPLGLPDDDSAPDPTAQEAASTDIPTWPEVLAARADRQAMVRDFISTVSAEQLSEERPNPHAPAHAETVLSCLHTILEEEWEHHRYAVRDLDALEGDSAAPAR